MVATTAPLTLLLVIVGSKKSLASYWRRPHFLHQEKKITFNFFHVGKIEIKSNTTQNDNLFLFTTTGF